MRQSSARYRSPRFSDMDPTLRLDLATRIHFGLLAQLGVSVAVDDLLDASPEGREALWVCEAMDDPELRALAHAFLGRTAPLPPPLLRDEVPPRRSPSARPAAPTGPAPLAALGAAPVVGAPGHTPHEPAWSGDTSGFGVGPAQELQAAPFLPTPDALEPSTSAPDISWATALRTRPQAPQSGSWKQALAFWRRG